VIPSKSDERRQPGFPRDLYRARNAVERCVNRLKQWRRVATRYDKRASTSAAFTTLVMLRFWL
jgi:transposase